jgi:hypothetical protein
MAVCEIWDVRGRLDHPIDYAENPAKTANPKYTEVDLQAMVDVMEYATNKNKTEQRFFVTGLNCDPTTARDEMMITKAQWNDMSEIVCYHGFQSFKHGDVTPEQAHEVGVKLAERMWGDRFQVIVATHLNTDCLHNHFVVNSVSFADGMHYHDNKANLRFLPVCHDTADTGHFVRQFHRLLLNPSVFASDRVDLVKLSLHHRLKNPVKLLKIHIPHQRI